MENKLEASTQFINTTSSPIFLTGKAGTGKTTFLKNLNKYTHKKFLIVAPTGIAALNAGGVTIHSQFLLPPLTFLPDRTLSDSFVEANSVVTQSILARKNPLNSERKQVLRSIDLLVIDEVSMLRADLLDAIDYRMKAARGNFSQSFGGVQVLFIGDLFQLPPVIKDREREILSTYYNNFWFYEAKALQNSHLVYIELDKIFRQTDSKFINILNNLRNNFLEPQDIEILNQHYKTKEEIQGIREVITLTTHNNKAYEINKKELMRLSAPSHFFDAYIEGDYPESMYPVRTQIELKKGAQIMFVRNDNENKMYYNGKLATVVDILNNEIWVEMAETHLRYKLKKERWENKKYTVNKATQNLEEDIIGVFEQYPVKLAWAITVHKSQGLTFDKAIIDVGQAFATGQVYVALSRLRSLDGLILRTRINPSAVSTDSEVVAFAKANHRPDELASIMKQRQQQFIREQINETFDFSLIIKNIEYLSKKQTKKPQLDESTMKPMLEQISEALSEQKENTYKFRNQLSALLNTQNTASLIDRLNRGSAFYENFLLEKIKLLLRHIEAVKLQKRVKTYLNNLNEVDSSLNKKLEEVGRISFLVESILLEKVKFDFVKFNNQLIKMREELLNEIQKETGHIAPSTKKKAKSKESDSRKTHTISSDMINQGLTVEQVASQRGLVISTIEGHLAKAVENNILSVFKYMDEEVISEISNNIRKLPADFSLKDLYFKMNGKYSYGKIRAVVSHVNNQKK